MRTSKGVKPANLDLFLKLDKIISDCEAKHKSVSFLTIPYLNVLLIVLRLASGGFLERRMWRLIDLRDQRLKLVI
jgi:hypothetical protein